MVTRRALIAFAMLLALLSGCTPTVTGSPSPSPSALDLTEPGVAQTMVRQLLTEAGSQKALMVKITATTAQVSALKGDQVITWAYRDGESAKAASDLAYVNQATFDVAKYSFSDVGALFRAAAGQSGSSASQSLTIVDNSASQVMMSVSTEPESRTVFFTADGALMEILDFDTVGGIGHGITDAIGSSQMIYSATIISDQGVSADSPGNNGTTIRRTRAAKVPTTTRVLSSAENLPLFAAGRVNPATIWKVVGEIRGTDGVSDQSEWSVTIDNRDSLSVPRMHFTFGFTVVVADLDGTIISQ